jgi:hypothetical protein
MLQLHNDFMKRGELFTKLREMGITGFGIYDTFVHLDCRDADTSPAKQSDHYGRFAFWDKRSSAVKKKLTTKQTTMKTPMVSAKRRLALSGG